jgi:predicted TIM-barrel fold metal-dependent hydrolase
MIDIHTHIGYIHNSAKTLDSAPLSAEGLVRMMDREGITQACVLPLVSPETTALGTSAMQVIEECRAHSDRLIPFANVDPRSCGNSGDADFMWVLEHLKDKGCRGMGEVTANLPFDDPRVTAFLDQCGRAGLPVTIHVAHRVGSTYGLVDDIHLPRLELILQQFPDTVIVGHAQTFWAEISGDVKEEDRGGYPSGVVAPGGRIQILFDMYDNLYGDLSANSGFNALNRDPEHAREFLVQYSDRLMFATDYLREGQDVPLVQFLKDMGLPDEVYSRITRDNARNLYNI